MPDVEGTAGIGETPEADALEQHQVVDFDDEPGLDTDFLSERVGERDANDADVIDQAFVVPVSDEWEQDY